MGDLSKEIHWQKCPAPFILATRRHPDESIQNTHRERQLGVAAVLGHTRVNRYSIR